jgi:predicted ATP-dependent serine protease
MGRTISVSQMANKKYDSYPLNPKWEAALGEISRPFKWLVFGKPKNGKTSFIMQFCRAAAEFCKVYYNSMEEGDSKTMQQAILRADMINAPQGKFMLGDRDTFPEMMEKLKKNRCAICVIDSRDYMKLTTDQYKKLTTTFPRKSFIIICWEQSGKPLGKYAKDIEFMVDMVTHVKQFTATTNGRFGAQLKYQIWDKKPVTGEQQTIF